MGEMWGVWVKVPGHKASWWHGQPPATVPPFTAQVFRTKRDAEAMARQLRKTHYTHRFAARPFAWDGPATAEPTT